MTIAAQCRNFTFWLPLTKNDYKLFQIAYNDIKWEENKAFWSKKIKSLLEQIGLGYLWMKAHYVDMGIINIIRQRLKDIELQRWLSEINNDIREDANQGNKMRTYRFFKRIDNYKCEDYLHQVTNTRHRIALTKLRLSNHKLARRDRTLFETVQETCRKNLSNLQNRKGGRIPFSKYMPCLPGKTMFVTRLFGKRIWNKNKQHVT